MVEQKFSAGETYTVTITISPRSGYNFTDATAVSIANFTADDIQRTASTIVLKKTFQQVEGSVLTGIEVTTRPTKTSYVHGEAFDPSGMVVKATYDDGTENPDYKGYTVTYAAGNYLKYNDTSVTLTAENNITVPVTGLTTAKKELELAGVTATDREYDGTRNVTVSGGNLNGIIPGELVGFEPVTSGTVAESAIYVGKKIPVTVATPRLTGEDAGNYTLKAVADVTVNITARKITITADSDSKVYDKNPLTAGTAKITSGSIAANDKQPTVTVEGSATNVGDAGENKITSVVIRNLLDQNVTSNYDITRVSGKLTITPKTIADDDFTDLPTETKKYTGSPLTQTITGLTEGENADYTVEYSNNTNVGTASYTITGHGNYTGTITKEFAIEKGNAPTGITGSVSLYHKSTTEGKLNAPDLTGAPATGWTGVKFTGTPTISDTSVIASASVDDNGVLHYTPTGTAGSGKTATIKVNVASDNYEDATVTITFTTVNINIPWPTAGNGITIVGDPVYGMTNGDILKVTSDKLTATTTVNVPGTISVKDAAVYPAAGTTKVTLIFTPDAGYGVSGTFEYDYTITAVRAKDITVDADAISVEYGQSIPTLTFTVPDGALVGSDTKESLGLSLQTNAIVGDSVGSYEISMRTCENKNYHVTVNGTRKLTITQASITKIDSWETLVVSLNANHSANTSIASLKTLLNLPTGYPVYYAGGKIDMPVDWDDGSGTFNVKGGEYTFTGTIKLNNNFKNDKNVNLTLMAKVVVSPVMVTAITLAPNAATVAKSQATSASDLANLTGSVTATVTWDPTVVSDDDLKTLTPTWNTTIDAVKSAASQVSTTDTTMTLMMNNTFPAWATVEAAMPTFALTITPKYPVNVAFTTSITDTVYGTALATPVAEQMDAGHGTDGTITYTYYTASGTKLGGAPTNVGSYKVVAEVVSDTHSGKAECAFQITPRTATLVWDGTAERTFDNQNSAVTATVSNKIGSDNGTVTVTGCTEKNAGTHTATATALTGEAAGNYQLPESGLTQDYTITRADRGAITDVQDTTLAGKTLSAALTPEVEHDLDRSASFTFVSADPSVVSVSSNGKVTALANGSAVITITVPATTNYNAASKTVTITAVATPVTGVSVPDDATYTATLDGQTIKVAGYIASDGSVTITPTLADGVTGNAVTIAAADLGKNAQLEVMVDGEKIVYTVDTSAVTVKKANVTLHTDVTIQNADGVTISLTSPTATGLDAATAKAVLGRGKGRGQGGRFAEDHGQEIRGRQAAARDQAGRDLL